jgi:phosphocarrier protein HPr
MKVNLSKITDVSKFVNTVVQIPIDIDLVSGRYTVDAKSIMGILSLDLSKPVNIVFREKISASDYEKLKSFIV